MSAKNEDEMDLVTNDAVDMFVQLYGSEIFGPRIQDYFRNAVLCLMEQPEGGTLVEIVRLFTDEAYQKIKVKNVKNPVVRARWDKTYGAMGDREKAEMIPYFQAKFGPFTTTPILRNIIGQPESSFDIEEAMNSGKCIIMNLAKGKMGDINANLLGMMIVSQMRLVAFRRAKQLEKDRVPHFLYIDEFQNFVTPAIESILSEARKYKLGIVLAHQYIGQLIREGSSSKGAVNLK
ncbi:ATP-binding protein, partial [Patescibacteria group bacterium]|nr:ATP-binding protein [Patescibacteria group bacterium]